MYYTFKQIKKIIGAKNDNTYENVYDISLPKPKRPNFKQTLAQQKRKQTRKN